MAQEDTHVTNSVQTETDSPEAPLKDKPTDLPPAPDGGWGWVVVFGSFMVHVVADGIAYSFGIYVTEFIEYFECSRSEVGWLGSLMIGVTWGAGMAKNYLINFVLIFSKSFLSLFALFRSVLFRDVYTLS